MRTRWKLATWVLACVVCVGLVPASAASRNPRKTKKPQLPPLPSGPRGPVPQIPLDSIPAVAPQVSYQSGQLTIVAPNSTLGDILRAVRKTTAAEIEIPANANERVVTRLGPGPARDVVAELLNGSRFNYVLLGSPADANLLTRVVLVAKSADAPAAKDESSNSPGQPVMGQPGFVPPPQPEAGNVLQDNPDAEATEENPDDNADQNATEADQPPVTPEQPGVKTPQQMLQEMQQRQLQMQQQQPPGQAPIPGGAAPPQRPPEQ